VALAWFLFHGASEDFFTGVFAFAARHRQALQYDWVTCVRQVAISLVIAVPHLILAAAAGLVLLARRDRALAAGLAAWVAIAVCAVIAQRQLSGYHYLLPVPALALAAGVGCALLWPVLFRGTRPQRMGALVLLLAVAGLFTWRLPTWASAYAPSLRLVWDPAARETNLAAFDVGNFSPLTEERVAGYLRQHTTADDSLLVWGLGPGIYALADRQPVTRFPLHKVLYTYAPLSRLMPGLAQRRMDLMARMEEAPPGYIVVGHHDGNAFEPEDSRVALLAFPQLASFVRDRYVLETAIGHFLLYRRTAPSTPRATSTGVPQ
jgi:hypothetical protein